MALHPRNMIEMDFEVLSETFSRYLVQDGTTLKVKIVVKKIFRTAQMTAQGYPANVGVDSINVVAAIVPPSLKKKPSKERWDPTKDIGKELKFTPQQEEWQTYMTTEGFKVLIKPVLTKVIRFDKYNDFGEPIYTANVQAITNIERISSTA